MPNNFPKNAADTGLAPGADEGAIDLDSALVAAALQQDGLTDPLRDALSCYVDTRRQSGLRAEQVVICLKRDLREDHHVGEGTHCVLLDAIVSLAIRRYYDNAAG